MTLKVLHHVDEGNVNGSSRGNKTNALESKEKCLFKGIKFKGMRQPKMKKKQICISFFV